MPWHSFFYDNRAFFQRINMMSIHFFPQRLKFIYKKYYWVYPCPFIRSLGLVSFGFSFLQLNPLGVVEIQIWRDSHFLSSTLGL